MFVKKANIIKNIGDKTECWVFRNLNLDPNQLQAMLAFADGAVESGGRYSVGGIIQFGLQYLGIKKKISDEAGVFCTEFTSRIIDAGGLPYITKLKPFEIAPSYQLNWFLGAEAKSEGWYLAAHYIPNGKFFVS